MLVVAVPFLMIYALLKFFHKRYFFFLFWFSTVCRPLHLLYSRALWENLNKFHNHKLLCGAFECTSYPKRYNLHTHSAHIKYTYHTIFSLASRTQHRTKIYSLEIIIIFIAIQFDVVLLFLRWFTFVNVHIIAFTTPKYNNNVAGWSEWLESVDSCLLSFKLK